MKRPRSLEVTLKHKIPSGLLIFFFLWSPHSFSFVPGLLEQGRKMVGLLQEGKNCSLKVQRPLEKGGPSQIELCTGLTLRKNDLNFLKGLDLKSCKNFLKQMKYQVLEVSPEDSIKGLNQEIKDFFSSTKLALILHKERKILFKNKANRGDCIHEVLHFYQRHRENENPLSPIRRKEAEERLQLLLEKAVVEVEKVEKKGDKEKAKKMAGQLSPFIQLQKEWKKMINWLDEKEIYQLFFDFPGVFGFSERDIDISLANLVRLQDSLPWRLKERVLYRGNLALNKKYQEVRTPLKWSSSIDEREWTSRFERGEISRESFEKNVIGLRKYLAKVEADQARRKHDLLKELTAMTKLRDFSPRLNPKGTDLKFNVFKKEGLPAIKLLGKTFILDTGAQHSSMPTGLLKKFKRKDVSLVNVRSIKSLYGKVISAPVIQVKKGLIFGDKTVHNLTFTVADLNIPGIDGVIGMDFFRDFNAGKWTIDLKKGVFSAFDPTRGVTHSFFLEKNGLSNYDSLSFYCRNKLGEVKVRIDSGSQVLGDSHSKADLLSFERCFGKGTRSKLKISSQDSLLFDKDVAINLGFPFLEKFNILSFNLTSGEIFLTEGEM